MAKKLVTIDGIGTVTLYKRKRSKSIRLSVTSSGDIRVTMPFWTPYKLATEFVIRKTGWLQSQVPQKVPIRNDDLIGRQHRVQITYGPAASKIKTRVSGDIVAAKIPFGSEPAGEDIQVLLRAACERALRKEAHVQLPRRLSELAAIHDFTYDSVSVKRMRSRWGSCSNKKAISLNIYLMQLDDELIDYVLLHELVHTRILAHGRKFWDEMARYVDELPHIRKRMRVAESRLLPK